MTSCSRKQQKLFPFKFFASAFFECFFSSHVINFSNSFFASNFLPIKLFYQSGSFSVVFCRVSHIKNSSSSNPNLRTFDMFEGVKQPSYSRTKTRSLSPMPSSHLESPSSSIHSPIQNKSLSPQPQTNVKRRGTVLLKLYSICLERIYSTLSSHKS